MANPNVGNVLVGKPLVTGGILVAPLGTPLPTSIATVLNAAFAALGYVTDAGLTKSDAISSNTVYSWGGGIIATPQKSREVMFKFVVAEHFNALGHSAVYGDQNVVATPSGSSHGNQLAISGNTMVTPPRKAWVFEIYGGAGRDRIVVPAAQVTAVGDVVYKDDDIASRELTLTAFPDSSGNSYYEYTDDGVITGP